MVCMGGETSLLTYLPVASFSLAAGGLGVRFVYPAGPARQSLLAAVLIFIVVASGLVWYESRECKKRISEVAEDVLHILGNEKRTYEQIVLGLGLRNQNYYQTNASLDLLLHEKRIRTEVPTIVEKETNKTYPITFFSVRNLQPQDTQ